MRRTVNAPATQSYKYSDDEREHPHDASPEVMTCVIAFYRVRDVSGASCMSAEHTHLVSSFSSSLSSTLGRRYVEILLNVRLVIISSFAHLENSIHADLDPNHALIL